MTPVQIAVLTDLSCGLSEKEISYRHHITRRTVKAHVSNARLRLGARTKEQMIAFFVARYGLPVAGTLMALGDGTLAVRRVPADIR